jgi:hypothetical protein
MTTRAMKTLLASLGREASKTMERPADPLVVMRTFCQAMSARTGRPIDLVFRAFPVDVLEVVFARCFIPESAVWPVAWGRARRWCSRW